MDNYDSVRALPLAGVLAALEFPGPWRTRKSGTEWAGKCPVHNPVKNTSSFSFDASGKFKCFSCNAHGRGAIDLTMAVKQIGFREAVEWLLAASIPDCGRTQNSGETLENRPETLLSENPPFPVGTRNSTSPARGWPSADLPLRRSRGSALVNTTTRRGQVPTKARFCFL